MRSAERSSFPTEDGVVTLAIASGASRFPRQAAPVALPERPAFRRTVVEFSVINNSADEGWRRQRGLRPLATLLHGAHGRRGAFGGSDLRCAATPRDLSRSRPRHAC